MEAVGQEHWLEYAIWPGGKRIEYVPGLRSKPAIGSVHRRCAYINGSSGRPESGGYEARMHIAPDRPPCENATPRGPAAHCQARKPGRPTEAKWVHVHSAVADAPPSQVVSAHV